MVFMMLLRLIYLMPLLFAGLKAGAGGAAMLATLAAVGDAKHTEGIAHLHRDGRGGRFDGDGDRARGRAHGGPGFGPRAPRRLGARAGQGKENQRRTSKSAHVALSRMFGVPAARSATALQLGALGEVMIARKR